MNDNLTQRRSQPARWRRGGKASTAAAAPARRTQSDADRKVAEDLIRKSVERKLECERLTMEWQERLWAAVVLEQVLYDAARYMQPVHYDEVVEERNAGQLCGYPLCSNEPMTAKGRYKIDSANRKIIDLSVLRPYCSQACFTASAYYKFQLDETPVFMRDLTRPVHIDVTRLDTSSESALREYIRSRLRAAQETLPAVPGAHMQIDIVDRTVPSAPQPVERSASGQHSHIEGFQVHFDAKKVSRSKASASTMVLSRPALSPPTALPTTQTQAPLTPPPSSKPTTKPAAVSSNGKLQLSNFGIVFHLLGRAVTPQTKRFLCNQHPVTSGAVVIDGVPDERVIVGSPERVLQRGVFVERLRRIMHSLLLCLRISDAQRTHIMQQLSPLTLTMLVSDALVDCLADDNCISWSLALALLYGVLHKLGTTDVLDGSSGKDFFETTGSAVLSQGEVKWIATTALLD
ncbi:hypothetical protein RI367_005571 [Sorochytrium milnesiophthora]